MRNTKQIFRSPRLLALVVSPLVFSSLALEAAPFTNYSSVLILGFRQSGQNDLVVNIGPASLYDALPVGTTIPVTNLSASVLTNNFSSLDALSWSVSGAERGATDPYPIQTIWASAPRATNSVQSTPWLRKGSFAQGGPAGQIASVGANAATYSSANAASPENTTNLVAIPATDPNSYTRAVSNPDNPTAGESDFNGTFQGNVENITPDDFDSAEPLSRLDLYELLPGTTAGGTVGAPGKLVGTFNFTPDGAVTFTAGASAVPARPTITGIQRNGSTTTVSFASTSALTYSLYFTNAAGLTSPISSWATSGATAVGTGAVLSLQHTNTAASLFYAIGVHP